MVKTEIHVDYNRLLDHAMIMSQDIPTVAFMRVSLLWFSPFSAVLSGVGCHVKGVIFP